MSGVPPAAPETCVVDGAPIVPTDPLEGFGQSHNER